MRVNRDCIDLPAPQRAGRRRGRRRRGAGAGAEHHRRRSAAASPAPTASRWPAPPCTIVHVESGSTSNLVTDAEGRYNARGLRVGGPYTITITKDGADRTARQRLPARSPRPLTLDVQLGAPAQTIIVTGRGVNDRFNSTGDGCRHQHRQPRPRRPSPRSSATCRTTPASTRACRRPTRSAARSRSAARTRATTRSPSTASPPTTPSASKPTTCRRSSSRSRSTRSSRCRSTCRNYDVTQKGYTGANINAVTKCGTNDFHGSVYYVFRDDNLVGDRYNRTTDTLLRPPAVQGRHQGLHARRPDHQGQAVLLRQLRRVQELAQRARLRPARQRATTNVGITPGPIDAAIAIAQQQPTASTSAPSSVPGGRADGQGHAAQARLEHQRQPPRQPALHARPSRPNRSSPASRHRALSLELVQLVTNQIKTLESAGRPVVRRLDATTSAPS